MKVEGTTVLHASPAQVYAALTDPRVLVHAVPGCSAVDRDDSGACRVSAAVEVASVHGGYDGTVQLVEATPGESLRLRASMSGATGTLDASMRVELAAARDASTDVSYQADAVVGGMVAAVGSRLLASAAGRLAVDFFAAVDTALTGLAADAEVGHEETPTVAGETASPVPAPAPARPNPGPLLAAGAAAGAAAALLAAAVIRRLRR